MGLLDRVFGRHRRERRQLPGRVKRQIRERDNYTCQDCGRSAEEVAELHVHHITPKSEGGLDAMSNLVTLCDYCHSQRPSRGHDRIRPKTPPPGRTEAPTISLGSVMSFAGLVLIYIGVFWAYRVAGVGGLILASVLTLAVISIFGS